MTDHLDHVDEAADSAGSGAAVPTGEVVYDCAAWAGETRRLLAGLLDNAEIDQAWQGPSLTVRAADEARVDELVEELLGSTTGVALPDDAETVVFATAGWSVSMQTALVAALAEEDVAYEWDEQGDLRVLAEHDEVVALLLDDVAEDDEDLVSSDDGVALHALLGEIFGSASKLAKRPRDASSLVTIADSADLMRRLALPFGFERQQWAAVVERVETLADLIDGETHDDDVAGSASELRDAVRPYV